MRKLLFGTKVKCVVSMMFVLLVVAGCGSPAPTSASPTQPRPTATAPVPTGNQPPVISALTPEVTQTFPNGNVKVQCNAVDPEGGQLSYVWSATGGKIEGSGGVVTWTAPSIYGTYNVTCTVTDSQQAMSQATRSITVVANQNPVINSLSADPTTVGPGPGAGSNSPITVIASDPDGEVVTYNWSAGEGTITGVGNKITWQAPNKGGDFLVKVTVSDGKGGSATSQVVMTVSIAEKTQTLTAIQQYTGTVWKDGLVESTLRTGVDFGNRSSRSFFTFNTSTFAGKTITNAKITFTVRQVVGDPFNSANLKGLYVERVNYGDRALQPIDYGISASGAALGPGLITSTPSILDVTNDLNYAVNHSAQLYQFRLRFSIDTDGHGADEYIDLQGATLTLSYKDQ
jgi:hypothetical protein